MPCNFLPLRVGALKINDATDSLSRRFQRCHPNPNGRPHASFLKEKPKKTGFLLFLPSNFAPNSKVKSTKVSAIKKWSQTAYFPSPKNPISNLHISRYRVQNKSLEFQVRYFRISQCINADGNELLIICQSTHVQSILGQKFDDCSILNPGIRQLFVIRPLFVTIRY